MAKFRLLAGQHIARDPRYKRFTGEGGKVQFKGPDGDVTDRPPSITYGQGSPGGVVVESDVDLVKRHGANKFERMSGHVASDDDPPVAGKLAPKDMVETPGVFPGGQVSSGHQVSTSGRDGGQITGAMTEDSIPQTKGEKQAGAKADAKEAAATAKADRAEEKRR